MRTIVLHELESIQSRLIYGAKLSTLYRWKSYQAMVCKNIGAMMELRIMFNVAHAFGIEVQAELEMSKYNDFLCQVWETAKRYEVVIK